MGEDAPSTALIVVIFIGFFVVYFVLYRLLGRWEEKRGREGDKNSNDSDSNGQTDKQRT